MKKFVARKKNLSTFADGGMAEWSNAAVLKTVELRGSGGSNPSSSASKHKKYRVFSPVFLCLYF